MHDLSDNTQFLRKNDGLPLREWILIGRTSQVGDSGKA
jgi:hypothetical protein